MSVGHGTVRAWSYIPQQQAYMTHICCMTLLQEAQLPDLRVGDWLMFPNAGAYTVCAASNYGGAGCAQPDRFFVCSSP